MSDTDKIIRNAVREMLNDADPDTMKHASMADWDLYYGPGVERDPGDDGPPYPGFGEACEIIRAAVDAVVPSDLYVLTDCDILVTEEPEPYELDSGEVDEDGGPVMEWCEAEDCTHYDRRAILRATFGALADYL